MLTFHWGPDNRIHGATGLSVSHWSPLRPDMEGLSQGHFSFDQKPWIFARKAGAQHGMSFDADWNKLSAATAIIFSQWSTTPFLRVRTQWFVLCHRLEHCAGWSNGTVPHQSRRTMARDAHTVAGWRCLGPVEGGERLRGISPQGVTLLRAMPGGRITARCVDRRL